MTVECAIAVALPLDEEKRKLVDDIRSAAERARKADPGDRVDIIRFETLSSQLEAWALARRSHKETFTTGVPDSSTLTPTIVNDLETPLPAWLPAKAHDRVDSIIRQGGVLIGLRLGLEPGLAARTEKPKGPPPAADVFETSVRGAKAVEKRFEDQLLKAADRANAKKRVPISPSGIQNRILTETLRTFVGRSKSSNTRIDVPVEYRDGSLSRHKFPLRCLDLASSADGTFEVEVSFSLLSIRHTEMDALVDGCWLRNMQISQPRSAAETDDLVFDISRKQLDALTKRGSRSVRLLMYQTGLDTAIVGFYRAVTHHLLQGHAKRLVVVPMYFHEAKAPKPTHGANPRHNSRAAAQPEKASYSGSRQDAGPPEAAYGEGKIWATVVGGRR